MATSLLDYPFVVVRLRCDACERRGSYRLARLAEKWGAGIGLDKLLFKLSYDCPWRREKYSYRKGDGCHAFFPDLRGPPRPPDLPPGLAALRVIEGGKGKPQQATKAMVRKRQRQSLPSDRRMQSFSGKKAGPPK